MQGSHQQQSNCTFTSARYMPLVPSSFCSMTLFASPQGQKIYKQQTFWSTSLIKIPLVVFVVQELDQYENSPTFLVGKKLMILLSSFALAIAFLSLSRSSFQFNSTKATSSFRVGIQQRPPSNRQGPLLLQRQSSSFFTLLASTVTPTLPFFLSTPLSVISCKH